MNDITPTISYTALTRSRRTLADFIKTYLPLHGLDCNDFLEFWDILVFVEATIYQMDEENERLACHGTEDASALEEGMTSIKSVLIERGLMSDAILKELDDGMQFWKEERELGRMAKKMGRIPAQCGVAISSLPTLTELNAASARKSFDYRVLNLLVYGLRSAEPDPLLLEFLRVDERLVDVGDDLCDYEDDVLANSFNVYRCFIFLFGGVNAAVHLAKHIAVLETKHEELLNKLPTKTQDFLRKRMVAAAESPDALRWTLPTPILDEAAYRAQYA